MFLSRQPRPYLDPEELHPLLHCRYSPQVRRGTPNTKVRVGPLTPPRPTPQLRPAGQVCDVPPSRHEAPFPESWFRPDPKLQNVQVPETHFPSPMEVRAVWGPYMRGDSGWLGLEAVTEATRRWRSRPPGQSGSQEAGQCWALQCHPHLTGQHGLDTKQSGEGAEAAGSGLPSATHVAAQAPLLGLAHNP